MALSNVFREPRRELTESIVGTVFVGFFFWGDYHLALWFHDLTGGDKTGCPWLLGMILVPIILLGLSVLFLVTPHLIGESICNSLARRGLELRPKRRN